MKKIKQAKTKQPKVNVKNIESADFDINSPKQPLQTMPSKNWLTLALGALVVLLLFGQGWPIVAIVNFRPIFRWQLNQTMKSRYGLQTLEQIISEQLISTEANKQKVAITQGEVDAKTAEIVKGLGENVSLEDLLAYQGMTEAEFESQLRLQLLVTKMLSKNITITDEEVSDYITNNQSLLSATTEAGLKDEAKTAILDQKISEQLQTWFGEIKSKAKIYRLL